MRITTYEQALELEELIGRQNVAATKRALEDGAWVFVFRSLEEAEACEELGAEHDQAVAFCRQELNRGESWAGWVIPPRRKPAVGFMPDPALDTHGDVHGGHGSNHDGIH